MTGKGYVCSQSGSNGAAPLAIAGGWRGDDLSGAARLSARRHHVAAASRRLGQAQRPVILSWAMSTADLLPDDVETLSLYLLPRAKHVSHHALLMEKLKYAIRKLRHERFGRSSESGTLLDQLEPRAHHFGQNRTHVVTRPNACLAAKLMGIAIAFS